MQDKESWANTGLVIHHLKNLSKSSNSPFEESFCIERLVIKAYGKTFVLLTLDLVGLNEIELLNSPMLYRAK